ncbi:transaldolase, partial [Synechococcus sp. R60.2]
KKHTGRESYPPAEDPGVQSVTQIYNYFRKYDFPTEVMGASFRNIGEIIELAGCDLLTISPALLAELQNTEGHLERKLDPEKAKKMDIPRLVMDRATFDQMHRENRMASEKLEEGIQGFSKALEVLEKLLTERLQKLEGAKETITHAAQDVFRLYDLDGDGFITREEWMGADRVFDALDTNQDGKITPEEMLVGLGAAVYLKN